MSIKTTAVLSAVIVFGFVAAASACERLSAPGVSRVLSFNTQTTPGFGKSFRALPLSRGELVLTFDDGPAPGSTGPILDILARECIRATFFMIGRRAEANPQLVARVRDGGHTIGSHSYSHRRLDTLPLQQAVEDIQRGYEAVEAAAFGPGARAEGTRLFRFPEYRSTPELVDFVRSRKGSVARCDF
jgi:peptidoglycan/xylan/chitin deacetylase (PgdA/CDA1 family)